MNKPNFINNISITKETENLKEKYLKLNTEELIDAIKKSAYSIQYNDLDTLLEIVLDSYNEKQFEIDMLHQTIEERIKLQLELSHASQKRFEQQAKMAAMGEMMDAVAHQWKQPLNALSMMTDILVDDFHSELIDEAYIKELSNDARIQISHMVNTLAEFRNFFHQKNTQENFSIQECLSSVFILVNDEFIQNSINIHIQSEEKVLLYGIENEFKHFILNVINNAKDAFNERDIKNRDIYIDFSKNDKEIILNIQDTAGGIPLAVINDIFKPNVTTKEEGKGTGIGLYMSTQIVEKLGGKLSVANVDKGAKFSLRIPL